MYALHRHRQLKDQYESHSHEMEMVKTRMEQSTHHQQLTQLQQLRDNIGKYCVGFSKQIQY